MKSCNECGLEFEGTSCPNCGESQQKNKAKKKNVIIVSVVIAVLVAVIVALVVVIISGKNPSAPDVSPETSNSQQTEADNSDVRSDFKKDMEDLLRLAKECREIDNIIETVDNPSKEEIEKVVKFEAEYSDVMERAKRWNVEDLSTEEKIIYFDIMNQVMALDDE